MKGRAMINPIRDLTEKEIAIFKEVSILGYAKICRQAKLVYNNFYVQVNRALKSKRARSSLIRKIKRAVSVCKKDMVLVLVEQDSVDHANVYPIVKVIMGKNQEGIIPLSELDMALSIFYEDARMYGPEKALELTLIKIQ